MAQSAVPLQASREKLLEDIPLEASPPPSDSEHPSVCIANAPLQEEAKAPEELIIVLGLQKKLSSAKRWLVFYGC